MDAKKNIKKTRKIARANFILNTQRTGQSKRLGHPSRQIIRPKKYVTTSSDKEKSIKRKYNRSEQINIGNNIEQIRKEINNNKENETERNNVSEYASRTIFNSPSLQLNPAPQLYGPSNVINEQNSSMPQRTYTELLPSSLNTSNVNIHTTENTSTFSHSASNSYIYEPYKILYEKSIPTTSTYYEPRPLTPRHEAHHYQKEPSRLSTCEKNYQNQAANGLEVEHQHEEFDNVTSKEDFDLLREELNEYFKTVNEKLDKLLRNQKRLTSMPAKPFSFPLQSIQQVEDFNSISDEEYESAVQYLHFLGGFTLHDAVKYCMKEVITDDAIKHYSAWGERGNLPLFETKLIKAIYDAVCRNSHFQKPLRDEFFREVGEAVRFGKQRNRNIARRMNERGRGRRQRLRREAENNLFGEVEGAHDAIDTDANDGDPESN